MKLNCCEQTCGENMDKITTRPQRVVVVVQRHSVLPGHLGLHVDVEHVLEEAHQLEVSLGQGLTLLLKLDPQISNRVGLLLGAGVAAGVGPLTSAPGSTDI